MQIDQKTIRRMLSMSDEQLASLMTQIAQESGIRPEEFGIRPGDMQSIRQALGNASEDDIQKMNQLYDNYRRSRRRR